MDSIKTTELDITETREDLLPVLVIRGVRGFSVAKIFNCGQCFRFDPVKNSKHGIEYAGIAFGRFFSVAEDGDTVYIYNCDRAFFDKTLCRFLSLDTDYDEIIKNILSHFESDYIREVVRLGDGLRILRQERWEALCSFIISQNNNIPRIKKIVRALSEACGERLDISPMSEHGAADNEYTFPSAEAVFALGEEGLRNLRTGFRAKYIFDAAKKVSSGEIDLDKTANLASDECLAKLCEIKGVGIKVASCTALFSMGKYDAFPIDVWIRRTLQKHFPENFDPALLGNYAGIAQQYMFYSARYLDN